MAGLNALTRSTLNEIARMAYGSGVFEKDSGGRGNMGILKDEDTGTYRIIKFNTHLFGNKSDASLEEQKVACDTLRDIVIELAKAAKVNAATMEKIREELGYFKSIEGSPLKGGYMVMKGKELLKRTAVARAIKLIDANVFKNAWQSAVGNKIDKRNYSTEKLTDTSFDTVKKEKISEYGCTKHCLDDYKFATLVHTHVNNFSAALPEAMRGKLEDAAWKDFASNAFNRLLPKLTSMTQGVHRDERKRLMARLTQILVAVVGGAYSGNEWVERVKVKKGDAEEGELFTAATQRQYENMQLGAIREYGEKVFDKYDVKKETLEKITNDLVKNVKAGDLDKLMSIKNDEDVAATVAAIGKKLLDGLNVKPESVG